MVRFSRLGHLAKIRFSIDQKNTQSLSFGEESGFNAKIFECIDKALDSLCEGVKPSFYHQIEEKYKLPKERFASRPLAIIEYLDRHLGPTGSAVVERLIVREVRKAFNLDGEKNLQLSTVINDAKRKFMNVY